MNMSLVHQQLVVTAYTYSIYTKYIHIYEIDIYQSDLYISMYIDLFFVHSNSLTNKKLD